MQYADKYMLVPNEGQHPFNSTFSRAVSELDNEMSDILSHQTDDRTKWRLYEQALQRYQNLKTQATAPSRIDFHESPNVLASIPDKYKAKAAMLLASLGERVDQNARGVLTINGVELPGANLGDLLLEAVKPLSSKRTKPFGWDTFKTLHGLNLGKIDTKRAVLKSPFKSPIKKRKTSKWETLKY